MGASVQTKVREVPSVFWSRVSHTIVLTSSSTGNAREFLLNNSLATILLTGIIAVGATGCKPHASADTCATPQNEDPSPAGPAAARLQPDLSGRPRFGKGSFYAQKFANRIMADGIRMNPHGDNAASRTLPLGTTARVTNVKTGQSAVVSIQDRGPYVNGRIVDLSPATAQKIGITRDIGVAKSRSPRSWCRYRTAAQSKAPRGRMRNPVRSRHKREAVTSPSSVGGRGIRGFDD